MQVIYTEKKLKNFITALCGTKLSMKTMTFKDFVIVAIILVMVTVLYFTVRSDYNVDETVSSHRLISYVKNFQPWVFFKEIKRENKCQNKFKNITELFDYLEGKPAKPCNDMREIGGVRFGGAAFDGQKFVCFDPIYKLLQGRCVVLSFGINHEWSFDDKMDRLGCEVYSFDPTMGVESFNRSEKIRFYNVGLTANKTSMSTSDNRTIEFESYKGVLTMLGLLEERIDYLKIDIEGSEYATFSAILAEYPELLNKITQIGVEVHPGIYAGENEIPPSGSFYDLANIIQGFECKGFELRDSSLNEVGSNHYMWKERKVSQCYEVFWTRNPDD